MGQVAVFTLHVLPHSTAPQFPYFCTPGVSLARPLFPYLYVPGRCDAPLFTVSLICLIAQVSRMMLLVSVPQLSSTPDLQPSGMLPGVLDLRAAPVAEPSSTPGPEGEGCEGNEGWYGNFT